MAPDAGPEADWYLNLKGGKLASKKALNAKNLEALGAERLAGLLIEISTGNAAAKRRLRLELAGAQSPSEVAKEVRKRLTTIARSRSFAVAVASPLTMTSIAANSASLGRGPHRSDLKVTTAMENAPGDASYFVGECNS